MKVNLGGEPSRLPSFRESKASQTFRPKKVINPLKPYPAGIRRRRRRPPFPALAPGCTININCGPRPFRPCYPYYPHPFFPRPQVAAMIKKKAPITDEALEKMSADEIIWIAENHPDPEMMGGRLRDFFKRAKKKAKQVAAKVATRFKKMPKWAKIATGMLIPGAPAVVATAATVKATKKVVDKIKNMPPEKKKKLAAGLAAVLVPGAAPAIATATGVKLTAKKVQQRRTARLAEQRKRAAALAAQKKAEEAKAKREAAAAAASAKAAALTASIPKTTGAATVESTEAKKTGIGTLLPLAALAIPFLLGKP